jgi:hypothetical protein
MYCIQPVDVVAVGIDEAEVGLTPGPEGEGFDLPTVGHSGLPRLGESRFDIVHFDDDLYPHTAGAGEVSRTEIVLRGQSAMTLQSDANAPRDHRHVPLRVVARRRPQAQRSTVEGHRPLNVVHEELEPHAYRTHSAPLPPGHRVGPRCARPG